MTEMVIESSFADDAKGMVMHRPSRMRRMRMGMLSLRLTDGSDEAGGMSHAAVRKWANSCNAPKVR